MRSLESITESPISLTPLPQNPNSISSNLEAGSVAGPILYNWIVECHGFIHNVFLIVSSLLFVLYLSFQAKKSFSKLSNGRSYIMIAYYGCLWFVSLLNLAWCCLQVSEFSVTVNFLGTYRDHIVSAFEVVNGTYYGFAVVL